MKEVIVILALLGILLVSGCTDNKEIDDVKQTINDFCKDNGFDDSYYMAGSLAFLVPNYACCYRMNGSVVLESYKILGHNVTDYKMFKVDECP